MKRGRNRRRALKDQLSPFVGRSVPLIVTGGEKINVRYAEKIAVCVQYHGREKRNPVDRDWFLEENIRNR